MLKRVLFTIFISFFSASSFAQVLNDTVKFLYGSHTTKLFNEHTVNRSKLEYYKKDTVFLSKDNPVMLVPDSLATDSIKNIQKQILSFDSLSTFKKDSIINRYKKRSFRNEYSYFSIDTALSDIHNYNYIYIKNNIFQNLGMLGTASKPVFYIKPTELGYSTGYTIFDHYFTEPRNLHYFNTRSSYTKFEYLANTGDENRVFAEFARNVNRFWNVGFSYQRLNSNKQFGKGGRTNDALASNQDFKIFTSGKSKNERYHFMGSFTYFVHKQNEQGGMDRVNSKVASDQDSVLRDNGVPKDIGGWGGRLTSQLARIEPARRDGSIYNRDRRVIWHFYHQYDVLKNGKLSFFHEFDHRNQSIRYEDPFAKNAISVNTLGNNYELPDGDSLYFYPTKANTVPIDFQNQFISITQKIGAKTQSNNFVFLGYLKYLKNQHSTALGWIKGANIIGSPFQTSNFFFLNGDTMALHNIKQNYAGVDFTYYFSDNYSKLRVNAEHIIDFSYQSETNFRPQNNGERLLAIDFNYKYFFKIGASTIRKSPTFLQSYIGNYMYNWANNFRGVNSTNFYISTDYKFIKFLNSSFKFSTDLLQDYVYFDTILRPQQSQTNILLNSLEINLATNKRGFNSELFTRMSFKNDPDNLYRMPSFLTALKLYYRIAPLKKKGKQQILIGIDVRYRNSYFGDAYRPELSLFHLQDDFKLSDMFLIDAFIDVKIKNTRVFGRMNQVNAFLPGTFFQNNGYFVSPLYPSARPFLSIGFSWMLYDN